MTSLVNLQSALSLLTPSYTPPNPSANQLDAIASPEKGASEQPISGAIAPAHSYNLSIDSSFSIGNGVISGSIQATETGNGPALTSLPQYQGFEDMLAEESMTDHQLTGAAYANETLGSGNYDDHTFLGDLNNCYGGTAEASQIQAALQNHTLDVQNVANVQGLDWTETSTSSTGDNGSGVYTGNISFNTAFLDDAGDGKQHALMGYGSVEVYLTW